MFCDKKAAINQGGRKIMNYSKLLNLPMISAVIYPNSRLYGLEIFTTTQSHWSYAVSITLHLQHFLTALLFLTSLYICNPFWGTCWPPLSFAYKNHLLILTNILYESLLRGITHTFLYTYSHRVMSPPPPTPPPMAGAKAGRIHWSK